MSSAGANVKHASKNKATARHAEHTPPKRGQTAFGFPLSIAQILVALLTCAILEFGITLRQHRVLMWPASALLTGNGIAFVLRVPGTEHGDWWSMNGWWIYAGTAAVAILSKHLIRFRGHHFLNPSNFALVLCFLVLGSARADPLALGIIVVGVFTILLRLHLLEIAVTFWVTFAIGNYDNDSSMDIAVGSVGGKLVLLRNTRARGNWLNGRRLVQELKAGSSYLSSEDPRAHFGLGREKKVSELIVRSPGAVSGA